LVGFVGLRLEQRGQQRISQRREDQTQRNPQDQLRAD